MNVLLKNKNCNSVLSYGDPSFILILQQLLFYVHNLSGCICKTNTYNKLLKFILENVT